MGGEEDGGWRTTDVGSGSREEEDKTREEERKMSKVADMWDPRVCGRFWRLAFW